MRFLLKQDGKRKNINEYIVLCLLGAVLVIAQLSLAVIPNVEIVSALIIVYAINFGIKSLYPVYIFAFIEILIFGIGIWSVNYLYVWPFLAIISIALSRYDSKIILCIASGLFGLIFGALCAIPYFFIGGISMATSYWISGIYFDMIHCIGNLITAFLIIDPADKTLKRLLMGIN